MTNLLMNSPWITSFAGAAIVSLGLAYLAHLYSLVARLKFDELVTALAAECEGPFVVFRRSGLKVRLAFDTVPSRRSQWKYHLHLFVSPRSDRRWRIERTRGRLRYWRKKFFSRDSRSEGTRGETYWFRGDAMMRALFEARAGDIRFELVDVTPDAPKFILECGPHRLSFLAPRENAVKLSTLLSVEPGAPKVCEWVDRITRVMGLLGS